MSPRASTLSAVLVASLAARDAAACIDIGDPCAGVEAWSTVEPLLVGAGVPTDGMLLLGFSGSATGEPSPAQVELIVTLDGAPVPGALEDIGVSRVLGWRPSAPLVPGAVYVVEGTLTNPELLPGETDCGGDLLPLAFEFTAAAGPMPEPAADDVIAEEQLVVTGAEELDNFVCCDGAFPSRVFSGCGEEGTPQIVWDSGHCAHMQSTGNLRVDLSAVLAPGDMTSMLHVEVRVDGVPDSAALATNGQVQLRASATKPFCTELAIRNVVTGDTLTTPQQCHGQALAAQLGPQTLTPDSPALAECQGPGYRCMTDESLDQWDPERCEPWPPGAGTTGAEPTTGDTPTGTGGSATTGDATTGPAGDGLVEHGCSCTDAPAAPATLALLLALACLPRRRLTR